MENKLFEYINFRSQLIIRYNVNLDETSASILFTILEEQTKSFKEQQKSLDKMIKEINLESNSLMLDNANPAKQAFWFGMGKVGFACSLAVLLTAISFVYFVSEKNENKKLSNELKDYKIYYERTQKLIQRKTK